MWFQVHRKSCCVVVIVRDFWLDVLGVRTGVLIFYRVCIHFVRDVAGED